MIAMAIACKPLILIADEPTTALDVTVQATILDLLRELRDENDMSMIFITHDLGVIAEIADRVMVMYHGKVVEDGPVFDIFNNPKHPYTKGLLACRPRLDLRLKVLPVVSDFMEVSQNGEIIERKAEGSYGSITDLLLKNYVTLEETGEKNAQYAKQDVILEVKNLKTYFPINRGLFSKPVDFVKAVDDVSFKIHYGETIGLVGESGCGKTTLGRSILHLTQPTDGQIIFHGKNINTYSKEELRVLRRDLQIIFQDPYSSLNPKMTVGEAIIEPMAVHDVLDSYKERKEKAIELLEKVNLKAIHFNRFPHEFSGGQRQRICIARALALHPSFIICDESVSALDVSVQAQVLNLLNKLKEEFQFTSIFISHDLSVVKFISDRIIVMNHGKIVEEGYSEDIYQNPKEAYTRKLIDSIPKGRLEDIKRAQLTRNSAVA
jgi:peptide/nickel transport system ATP-binding protein